MKEVNCFKVLSASEAVRGIYRWNESHGTHGKQQRAWEDASCQFATEADSVVASTLFTLVWILISVWKFHCKMRVLTDSKHRREHWWSSKQIRGTIQKVALETKKRGMKEKFRMCNKGKGVMAVCWELPSPPPPQSRRHSRGSHHDYRSKNLKLSGKYTLKGDSTNT